jgi:excinuclease ABC subunit A
VAARSGKNRSSKNGSPDTDHSICVYGARMHNLRDIDVRIPRDQLVVITGPSGSGKSSLAFDTLYAEGQRQYIDSLSAYARQFLDQMERPDVDLIDGLQPTISIDQRAGSHNPRSTVATVTEIYDYLRLLYARLGEVLCHKCGEPICQQTPEQICDTLSSLPEKSKVMLMSPLVRGRRGQHSEVFEQIRKAGFVRARVDGEVYDMESLPDLAPRKNHTIEGIVDRIVIRPGIEDRLAESIHLAVDWGEGAMLVSRQQRSEDGTKVIGWVDELYSTRHACVACGISYPEFEPRSFSFNSPYGACGTCEGLGNLVRFDPELVIPDESLSIDAGAIVAIKALSSAAQKKHEEKIHAFCESSGIETDKPIDKLTPKQRQQLLDGNGKKFDGLMILLEKEFATTTRKKSQERLAAFRGQVVCSECNGARLKAESRSVQIGGRAIHELIALDIAGALEFFKKLKFAKEQRPVAKPIVAEIVKRLEFLIKVGVTYLTLGRAADTLSGCEMQRVRLASSIGSGLVGVCYVLDEPSIGLHARDHDRLINALGELKEQGNTVVVVEHDEATMRASDYLIDMGPGAGQHGGQIISQGTPEMVCEDEASLTGRYLSGRTQIDLPEQRRRTAKKRSVTIEGVTTNNLQDVSVQVPLGALVCVTGVSGSGKSSLVSETLVRAIARRLGSNGKKPGPHRSLRGASQIDKLIPIDQTPIGRTPRSNPATYTGLLDEIRKVFATTQEAKLRGYTTGRFSFNVAGGRCEHCQGQGQTKIEMNFLPDMYVTCPQCNGSRYNRQTLECRYRDKSIADVLDMSLEEAAVFFENFPAMTRMLRALVDVGLAYLSLGQPSTTLSGGEAQRLKLATELGRAATGNTMYILDEPTTGLHFDDIRQLLGVLSQLVEQGNSVLVIEHNLDVIKSADWMIDLGPEGGAGGGQIIATGTPEQVTANPASHTGRFLRPLLNGSKE